MGLGEGAWRSVSLVMGVLVTLFISMYKQETGLIFPPAEETFTSDTLILLEVWVNRIS